MSELETLREFFKAYEAFAAMPKPKGRPGPELQAAKDLVTLRANAVKNWKPEGESVPASSPAASAYLALRKQVAEIAPKDTRIPNKSTTNV